MPFALTRNEILIVCGATYFSRGRRYQAQDRVESLEWDKENQILFSAVSGSGRNLYQQEIVFSRGSNEDRFTGDCSCPVGFNCKHVVAALLEWLEKRHQLTPLQREQGDETSTLQRWQEETSRQLQFEQSSQDSEPGQPCLLYLLQLFDQDAAQTIALQILKSRLLKKGGWGKGSNYPLAQVRQHHYYLPPEIAPLDIEIAQFLTPNSLSDELSTLHGDTGVLALNRLLRSGRCFFQSTENPPLSFGPKRAASFRWYQDEQDETRLDVSLEGIGHAWISIPTDPPWYLDPTTHQCGVIEQPLPAPLYHSLNNLPPVAAEQLSELSYFLWQKLPANTIPLPVELDIKSCDHPPAPRLILHAVIGPSGRRHHLARLRFSYGPLNLPPGSHTEQDSCLIRHNDEDWQVKRNPQLEDAAHKTLFNLNFRPAPDEIAAEGECDLYFANDTVEASALAWKQFIADIPAMETEGWQIELDESFQLSFDTVSTLHADIDDSEKGWFEVGLNIDHNGQKFPLLPLLLQWIENNNPEQPLLYNIEGSNWLEIPSSVLEPVVNTLVELFQGPQLGDQGQLTLLQPQALSLLELEELLAEREHKLDWRGGQRLRQIAEKMRGFKGIELVEPPAGLHAKLRHYQQQGLSWLQFLREYNFNGILADDMGLGKTIQALAHLQTEKEAGRLTSPALIVAPTSVISNWQREAARFTPELKSLVLHGLGRAMHFDQLDEYDLIITSYALLNRDIKRHLQRTYHSLILDEAQAIKNPNAKVAQAACRVKATHRLCLTGTPLENHLGELWSLLHFLMPGYLGDQKKFNKLFRIPIEKHLDYARQQQLQKRLAPFILRRDKSEVLQELPPKTLMVREVELNGPQAKLYETLRIAMTVRIDQLLQTQGVNRSHIQILDALLKLRQVCCDPRLVKLESARNVKHSAKLDLLMEMVTELLAEGRKILIFSQFTSMLSLIEDELNANDISYSKLTGRTRKRDQAIAAFQEGDVPLFLISLKAGGVGLNLTAADTVIHYDPWWNPAVENQATDRAHRIGQQKPVFVYKLVASGTVEEKILLLQEKKAALAKGVYQQRDKTEELPGMNADDLLSLLEPFE